MLFARRWMGWILLLMWLGSASAAETGGRVALVIGNGGYTALKTLPNPKNDAAAVARALKGLGYRLVDRDGKPTDKAELDLDQQGLFRAVNALAQAAQGQEIAFLYYAGHGFQDGANSYLVPVDAPKPERADDLDILKSRSIALDRVLGKVDGKAQLMVAVFDACREIPELNTAVRASGLGGDNNPYQGLLPVYRGGIREPAGQATRTSRLIAYAGAPGQLVKDGAGEHSPYTQLLLDQLTAATQKNKNIELTEFFQGVAWQFKSDPGGRQQPLLEVAAQPDTFYLLPGRPASASAPEPPSATTGTLVIRSSQPPGVVIYVNGGRLGQAPQSLNLPAGQQATVTAKQAGYEEYQEKVWIQAGQRMDLNVTLKPLASPPVVEQLPATTGTLMIRSSQPPGAVLSANDKLQFPPYTNDWHLEKSEEERCKFIYEVRDGVQLVLWVSSDVIEFGLSVERSKLMRPQTVPKYKAAMGHMATYKFHAIDVVLLAVDNQVAKLRWESSSPNKDGVYDEETYVYFYSLSTPYPEILGKAVYVKRKRSIANAKSLRLELKGFPGDSVVAEVTMANFQKLLDSRQCHFDVRNMLLANSVP